MCGTNPLVAFQLLYSTTPVRPWTESHVKFSTQNTAIIYHRHLLNFLWFLQTDGIWEKLTSQWIFLQKSKKKDLFKHALTYLTSQGYVLFIIGEVG